MGQFSPPAYARNDQRELEAEVRKMRKRLEAEYFPIPEDLWKHFTSEDDYGWPQGQEDLDGFESALRTRLKWAGWGRGAKPVLRKYAKRPRGLRYQTSRSTMAYAIGIDAIRYQDRMLGRRVRSVREVVSKIRRGWLESTREWEQDIAPAWPDKERFREALEDGCRRNRIAQRVCPPDLRQHELEAAYHAGNELARQVREYGSVTAGVRTCYRGRRYHERYRKETREECAAAAARHDARMRALRAELERSQAAEEE